MLPASPNVEDNKMNLATTIELHGYGTSEGVEKAWDTRGRKTEEGVQTAQQSDLASMHSSFKETEDTSAPGLAASLLNWIGKADQTENTLVLKDEQGQLCGAMLWGHTILKGKQYFEVNALAVHPDILTGARTAKGTGTKLMVAAAKLAAKENLGVELVASTVGEGFYRKIGMNETKQGSGIFTWSKEEARSFAQHG